MIDSLAMSRRLALQAVGTDILEIRTLDSEAGQDGNGYFQHVELGSTVVRFRGKRSAIPKRLIGKDCVSSVFALQKLPVRPSRYLWNSSRRLAASRILMVNATSV
jgi:hypothetical protein